MKDVTDNIKAFVHAFTVFSEDKTVNMKLYELLLILDRGTSITIVRSLYKFLDISILFKTHVSKVYLFGSKPKAKSQ